MLGRAVLSTAIQSLGSTSGGPWDRLCLDLAECRGCIQKAREQKVSSGLRSQMFSCYERDYNELWAENLVGWLRPNTVRTHQNLNKLTLLLFLWCFLLCDCGDKKGETSVKTSTLSSWDIPQHASKELEVFYLHLPFFGVVVGLCSPILLMY